MTSKLINYRELSTILTGKPDRIRSDRGTKQHKEAIKELNTILDLWINKHKK